MKTVLITGATSGIGLDASIYLSKLGYSIIAIGRDKDKLEKCLSSLSGNQNKSYIASLENEDEVKALFKELKEINIKVDAVICCAGSHAIKPVRVSKLADYRSAMENNFYSFTNVICNVSKIINKNASIVAVSSAGVVRSAKAVSAYASSKTALEGFIKSASLEFANNKIRINAIAPGVVLTKMTEGFIESIGEKAADEMELSHPLGFGEPRDVSYLLEFLISDKSRWLTGQTIILDGGFSIN